MKTKVALIAAIAPDRTIGSGNKMPWHMPRDLRFFRRATSGHSVIMGRKTFESLGKKALPKRKNIVVTRNADYQAEKCTVVHSLQEALQLVENEKRVFVIGGGELYKQSIDFADEIYLTEIIDKNPTQKLFPLFESDTFFPEISEQFWDKSREGRLFVAANRIPTKSIDRPSGLYFRFVTYTRKKINHQ